MRWIERDEWGWRRGEEETASKASNSNSKQEEKKKKMLKIPFGGGGWVKVEGWMGGRADWHLVIAACRPTWFSAGVGSRLVGDAKGRRRQRMGTKRAVWDFGSGRQRRKVGQAKAGGFAL
ncbi:hypothetical protein AWENTII_008645 [Aspergillus wentii]